MSRNSNDWNNPRRHRGRCRVNWESRTRVECPRGLRGKDIGLYYKYFNIKKQKIDRTINLKIPGSILTSLESNLKSISKIAAKNNIFIPQCKPETLKHSLNEKTDTNNKDNIVVKQIDVKFSEAGPSSAPDFIPIKFSEAGPSTAPDFIPIKFSEAGPSSAPDFISINDEGTSNMAEPKLLSFRRLCDYKYGYEDIITGTFEEKLDECIAKGIPINSTDKEIQNLNTALLVNYQDMLENSSYKSMLKFREKLPTYMKTKDLINMINNNQVLVISGETGCGKSTQVPQIILDDAICNNRGANVKILVTQPRRIAASSLAIRVSKERGEQVGNSVGYAVRLEKVEERARGSIQFCTTGILLADLEVNQGLTKYSHVILDEVHERDIHVDLSMCMLKQVLKKRKDLKLILMSATLDADSLSSYFDNCPLMHIEGLAYPVQDVFLEDILQMTKYKLPSEKTRNQPNWRKYKNKNTASDMEKDILYKKEISPWLESMKSKLSHDVYKILQDSRIEDMQLELIVDLLIYICKGKSGAILVFLPGISDITNLMKLMEESKMFPSHRYEIHPLHSKLPTLEQFKIFEKSPDDKRKIIIATNIAETSITIDDIVYVVDCGRIKISGLDIEKNYSTLKTEWVSKANLRQRRGRAGRCQPGICYHLLTSYRAEVIQERLLPELQRSNLLEPVLMIKKLRLGMAADAFKLVPSPPAESTIKWAVNHLQKCGALNENETLTPLGWHLARLPVHPAAGKLLIFGALFGCLDRAASIAAVWGFKDPFMLVIGRENDIDRTKRKFAIGEPSDHVAISEAILQWEACPKREQRSFAYDNFLSNNTLSLLMDMKRQLADNLKQMGFLKSGNIRSSWENRNANNLSLFKAIIAASLYPNIAHVKWKNLYNRRRMPTFTARDVEDGRLNIHPSSIMSTSRKVGPRGVGIELCDNPGANWLVYWLKQRSTDLFILEITLIYTLPLLFFGEFVVSNDEDSEDSCLLSISDIQVRCTRNTTNKLFDLRCLLDKVLASKITDTDAYSMKKSEFEEQVLKTVIQIITAQDEQAEYLDDVQDSDMSED